MQVIVSAEAASRLEEQIRYIREAGAEIGAERLQLRVIDFLENHLCRFPRTGRRITDRDLWETWIPGTKLVVWYQFTDEVLHIVTVWHASQDR